jgi:ABC-type cobalamin/Fe3+-siderophores transport system ATPase subunit
MLKSLEIKNFRALTDFKVSKLGQVNLIVGKNNAGKSSVLEALRIYAANGQRDVLEQIAAGHDEKYRVRDPDSDGRLPFEDFFSGRRYPSDDDTVISIGEVATAENALTIQHVLLVASEETVTDESGETSTRIRRRPVPKNQKTLEIAETPYSQAILITKNGRSVTINLDASYPRYRGSPDVPGITQCSIVPTQFITPDELALEWDKLVFSDDAEFVKTALRVISPEFDDIAFVVNSEPPLTNPTFGRTFSAQIRERHRSAMVKMSDSARAVPLNSLGDGMTRVLQLALKIFPAKSGILLIDEFENGLHFSVQEKVWALIFEIAQKLDIQVFATTHSWDCIESFARTANAWSSVEGVLFRVGRSVKQSDFGQLIATVFDREALWNITQADVEVR